MPGNHDRSPKRKAARAASKRGLRALTLKTKPSLGLAVDTSVSRHRGQVPQQVFPTEPTGAEPFPYESQIQEHRKVKTGKTSLKAQLENKLPVYSVPTRTVPGHTSNAPPLGLPTRPDVHHYPVATSIDPKNEGLLLPGQALHNRIKGLRPSPLDLTNVAPSDRAITNGNAIPSAATTSHTLSPWSAQSGSPHNHNLDAVTPNIVITPAREEFGHSSSANDIHSSGVHRPTSSVYSGAPRTANFEATPPVPPLPLFAIKCRTRLVREPTTAMFEDHSAGIKSHKATLSVCTVFEGEDDDVAPRIQSAKSLHRQFSRRTTSQSLLPTPRRSRGWWNVLTSPFSARSGPMFWRSPTQATPDNTAMLGDVSGIGFSEKVPVFTTREDQDGDPCSAPATDDASKTRENSGRVPKRSVTAPGALDPSAPGFNIYRVPSQGEAAAYYNQSRHFPSLYLGSTESLPRSVFEDDSPLTDVCACERHNHGLQRDTGTPGSQSCEHSVVGSRRGSECVDTNSSVANRNIGPENLASPFSDAHAVKDSTALVPPPRSIFTSPTADELKTATPTRTVNDRSLTQTTVESQFSPLSATPVVEHAHTATVVGPQSLNGEPRAVTVTPSWPASSVHVHEPASATTTSRDVNTAANNADHLPPMAKLSQRPVYHARSESYGLGISGSETELFPPPKPLFEKPRLGTDRWGQLTIVIPKDNGPVRPWYRRCVWLLVSVATSILLLLVVLLIMLIPRRHVDIPVQGQWLNLTGFPPLPTGITTVVQPSKVREESGCVKPSSLWSCAVPHAQQSAISPSVADQPNFRFEVRFKNATSSALNATSLVPQFSKQSGPASIGRRLLQTRDTWKDAVFSASPPAPKKDDLAFLGRTTDNTTAPFNGEETPFFLSLIDAAALSNLNKRQDSPYPYPNANVPANSTTGQDTASQNISTTATGSVPKPGLDASGGPTPATLYPLAQAQPLRLFNRGAEDEHYGFYTYFDRSIFISNMTDSESSPADANAALKDASAVCTWSQTRFHVQIWTRRSTALLSDPGAGNTTTREILSMSNATIAAKIPASNSTANDMTQPGSFPYPVTITIDRHGGEAAKKGLYCYGINDNQQVTEASMWVVEDRASGGVLVNPAAVPGADATTVNERDGEVAGGIDGGIGGCSCGWQNWT